MSKLFSDEVIEFIKQNTLGIGNKELSALINNTFNTNYTTEQIKAFKHRFKISSGLTGRFEKGHIPQNKGKKMSPEVYEKCSKTMFKKGNKPINHRPVGSERITRDGYIEVKIAEPNMWNLKHRVEWERVNGKVPKGYSLVFLDQNPLNIKLDNIMCIPNSLKVRLNQNYRLCEFAEVSKSGIALEQLKQKIRDTQKTKGVDYV